MRRLSATPAACAGHPRTTAPTMTAPSPARTAGEDTAGQETSSAATAAGAADLDATLASVRPDGAGRWVADRHMGPGGAAGLDRVHGGEMIAHAVTLAQAQSGGRLCTSINIVFAREARWELPTEFELTDLSAGRTYSFTAVRISQPGRGVVAHAQIALAAPRSGPSHQ